MEGSDDGLEEFVPLDTMPSMRLNDVVKLIEKEVSSVVNLDAIIPPREAGERVLKTLLLKLKPVVKVLSVRFNNFSPISIDYLIEYILKNDHIETLYFMGSGLEDKNRQRLEDAWRKNLTGHRKDNMGYTLIRVSFAKAEEAKLLEAEG
jgi:hypothetical protein